MRVAQYGSVLRTCLPDLGDRRSAEELEQRRAASETRQDCHDRCAGHEIAQRSDRAGRKTEAYTPDAGRNYAGTIIARRAGTKPMPRPLLPPHDAAFAPRILSSPLSPVRNCCGEKSWNS